MIVTLTPRLAILIDAAGTKAIGEFNKVTAASKALEEQNKKTAAAADLAMKTPTAGNQGKLAANQAAGDVKFTQLQTAQTVLLGKAALVTGGAIVAGFGLAEKSAMSFDKAMSAVNATSDLSAKQFNSLRDAALSTGQQFGVSATTAATAEQMLLKTGLSVSDVLGGGLKNALALATAGSLDVGDAASIAAQAMNAFGLSGSDFAHVADVLAAGSNHSAATVAGLGDAITQVGPLAHQMGLSLDQTVGALDMFAQKGADAGDAGTALRQFLLKLAPTSKTAQEGMKELGLDMFDTEGNFIGLAAAADQLKAKFGGLNQEQQLQALTTIFGARAAKSALPFVQEGAKAVDDSTRAISAQGAASALAAKKLDNLSGDIHKFGSTVTTDMIKSVDGIQAPFRLGIQSATSLASTFGSLPPVAQEVVGGIAGIGGAALTGIGLLAVLKPKIDSLRNAMTELGPAGNLASQALGKMGGVAGTVALTIGAIAAGNAVSGMIEKIQYGTPSVTDMTSALLDLGQTGTIGVGELSKRFGVDAENLVSKAKEVANSVGIMHHITGDAPLFGDSNVTKANKAAIDAVDKSLANMVTSGHGDKATESLKALQVATGATDAQFAVFTGQLGDYHTAQTNAANAAKEAGGATDGLTDDQKALNLTLDAGGNAVDSLGNKYDALGNKLLSMPEKTDKLTSAIMAQIDAQHAYDSALRAIGSAQDAYNDKVGALNKLLKDGAVDEDAVATATTTHNKALAAVTTATEKLTKAQTDLAEAQRPATAAEITEAQDKITDSLIKQRDAQSTLADAIKARDVIQKALDTGGTLGNPDDIVIAQQNVTDATQNYTKVLKNHKSTAGEIAAAHKAMVDAQDALTAAQDAATPTAEKLQKAQDDVTEAQIGLDGANKTAEDSTKNLQVVLAKGSDSDPAVEAARQGVVDATTGLADANSSATDADTALKKATDGDPDWSTKVSKARKDVADATWGIRDAQNNATGAAVTLKGKTDDEKTAFLTWGDAIDGVKTKLGQLQHDHPEIAGAIAPIFGAIANLINNTSGYNAQTGNFQAAPSVILAHQGRAATGGVFKAKPGGYDMNIAEGGQDEAVIPLDRWNGMSGGSGTTVNIVVNGALDPQSVAKQLDQILSRYNRGGNAAFLTN